MIDYVDYVKNVKRILSLFEGLSMNRETSKTKLDIIIIMIYL